MAIGIKIRDNTCWPGRCRPLSVGYCIATLPLRVHRLISGLLTHCQTRATRAWALNNSCEPWNLDVEEIRGVAKQFFNVLWDYVVLTWNLINCAWSSNATKCYFTSCQQRPCRLGRVRRGRGQGSPGNGGLGKCSSDLLDNLGLCENCFRPRKVNVETKRP